MYWVNRARLLGNKLTIVLTILIFLIHINKSSVSSSKQDVSKYQKILPTLGHISSFTLATPITELFEVYFESVLVPADAALQGIRKSNDYRVYRPTPELCLNKLVAFKINSYTPRTPVEFIPVDACLDWLFTNDPKKKPHNEEDYKQLTPIQKTEVDKLKKDSNLKTIYETTNFKKDTDFPREMIDRINEYMRKLLAISKVDHVNNCHGRWLETYLDFVENIYLTECEGLDNCPHFGHEGLEDDPYLKMILESTIYATRHCYNVINSAMRRLMTEDYENNKARVALKGADEAQAQSSKMKWSPSLMKILQLVQGVSDVQPIDLYKVARQLQTYKDNLGDNDYIKDFKKSLSDYAIENVDMKDTANDATGSVRWRRGMAKLCQPYIDESIFMGLIESKEVDARPYDFYGLVNSLVRITNHVDIFSIRKDGFQNDVILGNWDPLYFATFACQIISTTMGWVVQSMDTYSFGVAFRPEAKDLVADWPLEVFLEYYPNSAIGKTNVDKRGQHMTKFGAKFSNMFNWSAKDKSKPDQKDAMIHFEPEKMETQIRAKQPSPPKKKCIITLEYILFWKDLWGRYPKDLPPNIHELYPQLPKDLTQTSEPLSKEKLKKRWPNGPPLCCVQDVDSPPPPPPPPPSSATTIETPGQAQNQATEVQVDSIERQPQPPQQQQQPPPQDNHLQAQNRAQMMQSQMSNQMVPNGSIMQNPLMPGTPMHASMMSVSPMHPSMMQAASIPQAPGSPTRESGAKKEPKTKGKRGLFGRIKMSKHKDEEDEDEKPANDKKLQQLRDEFNGVVGQIASNASPQISPYAMGATNLMAINQANLAFQNQAQMNNFAAMQNGPIMSGMNNLVGLQTIPGLAGMQQLGLAAGVGATMPGIAAGLGAPMPGMAGLQGIQANGFNMGANFAGQLGAANALQMGQMYSQGANDWTRINANFGGLQNANGMGQHLNNINAVGFNGPAPSNNNNNNFYQGQSNQQNYDQRNGRNNNSNNNNRSGSRYDRDDFDEPEEEDYEQRPSRAGNQDNDSSNGRRDRRDDSRRAGSSESRTPAARGSRHKHSDRRQSSSRLPDLAPPARESRAPRAQQQRAHRRHNQHYEPEDGYADVEDGNDYASNKNINNNYSEIDKNYYDNNSDSEDEEVEGLVATQTRKSRTGRRRA